MCGGVGEQYEAPGPGTPQSRPGMAGHEAQDVATFCGWGVDYIKLDSKGSTRARWKKVRAAIDACPRPMYHPSPSNKYRGHRVCKKIEMTGFYPTILKFPDTW